MSSTDLAEKCQSIIDACLRMNQLDINQGTSGNISLRHDGGMLITPTSVPYEAMQPEQIVYMNLDGSFDSSLRPSSGGIPVADLTAGLFCAMGILTALLERDVSGEGQWVQTSLLQAQIFMLDFQASRWLMEQDVAKQVGNDHPTSIPTGVFRTSDGYINIATAGGKIWERCAQALGAPELPKRPEYATAPDRSKNRKALNAEINKLTEKKSTDTWVRELNAAGVPCGPIYSIDQMFDDEQVKHLGIAQDVPNAENRHIRLVGQPFKLSRTPSKMVAPPPEFGEQTEEVLAEFGFSAGEIAELKRRKVV